MKIIQTSGKQIQRRPVLHQYKSELFMYMKDHSNLNISLVKSMSYNFKVNAICNRAWIILRYTMHMNGVNDVNGGWLK